MIPQLVDRGFGYGSGTLSPDLSQFIVNIPKNASSYMLDWARRHQWMTTVADDPEEADKEIGDHDRDQPRWTL